MKEELPEAALRRHSVRSFTSQPLPEDVCRELRTLCGEINDRTGLRFSLVTDEPDAFGRSRMASYGKFSGVRNYLCIAGPKGLDVEAGFEGERLLLTAVASGLDTCWVGMTYSRKRVPVELREGEKVYALIAVGYGTTHGGSHKIKSAEDVAAGYATAPEWYRRGVDCALLAPTALNQQKFRFRLTSDGGFSASPGWGFYTRLDLGIALFHFSLGSGLPPERVLAAAR